MSAGDATEQPGFSVVLENFSGPFDVLLALIGRHKLDITEVALATVTDEFIAHVARLRKTGAVALEELSNFLVVASTLLDLKTARLLPGPGGDEGLDVELLEARDLLFARLLQYRAFKAVSASLRERIAAAQTSTARTAPLEERFHSLLPPVSIPQGVADLARLYAAAVSRDRTPPQVAVDHVHRPLVSVAEQRSWLLRRLFQAGRSEFSALVAGPVPALTVIARFLAVLELCKAHLCTLDQPEPLGPLLVAPTPALIADGPAASEAAFALAGVEPSDA